ncbi:MAG: hypothetical protein J2P50_09435 [Hyphomicrobiaceae bacterium]|nr:hypothetical protein [Hyphomicrobiaceae bacterium]
MPKSLAVGLALILLGLAVAVFGPLVSLGSSFGPGWGDILNGGVGVLLLLAGVIVAWIGARKHRRMS